MQPFLKQVQRPAAQTTIVVMTTRTNKMQKHFISISKQIHRFA
jgi:hypothetical protein